MAQYNFGKNDFTTNEISGAVAQAFIATFFTGGYLFDGFPRVVAKRNPSNDLHGLIDEENDTFEVNVSVEDISFLLHFDFAEAAAHARRFRKKEEPDTQLIELAETAVVKLGSILSRRRS